jgi:glycosyltransferase involved in cell wall biosynthesis
MINNHQLRVAVIGPIIIDGKSSGGEGEKLYQMLKESGYTVYKRSGYRNKLMRLLDTIYFIIIHRKQYDIVVSLVFSGRAFLLEYLVFLITKILNKKVIGVLHGGALNEFYKKYPNMVEKIYNQCIEICTPSKFLQQYFAARGWPVLYTPNFIDNNKFKPLWLNKPEYKLLWIRAFHDIYNPEMAIRCVANLKKSNRAITLTMVGPDLGKLNNCIELAEKLDVMDNIQFVGFVPNNEIQKYYHSHTVFITTTSYESFGVAIVEAASCGIPMVSTRVGEIPLMWTEDEEMLMADLDNQKEFDLKVSRLLDDTLLRDKLSKNAHRKAETYTWERVKMTWAQLLTRN